MRKCWSSFIVLIVVLLTGCSLTNGEEDGSKTLPNISFIDYTHSRDGRYVLETGPYIHVEDEPFIDKLPDGYIYVGNLTYGHVRFEGITEEEFLETGLDGCKIYADGSPESEYIYLETKAGFGMWKVRRYH